MIGIDFYDGYHLTTYQWLDLNSGIEDEPPFIQMWWLYEFPGEETK